MFVLLVSVVVVVVVVVVIAKIRCIASIGKTRSRSPSQTNNWRETQPRLARRTPVLHVRLTGWFVLATRRTKSDTAHTNTMHSNMRGKKHRFPCRVLFTCCWLVILVSLPLFSTSRLFRRITAELKDEDYYLNHSQGFTLEPMSKVPMSSDSLNCGCPGSCDATALAKRTDGLPFACQERIEYLMTAKIW